MEFRYKAKNDGGQVQEGTLEAPNKSHAMETLKRQGLMPLAVLGVDAATKSPGVTTTITPRKRKTVVNIWETNLWGKVAKEEEVLSFARDLKSVVDAGLPLVTGLEDIATHIRNKNFKRIIETIAEDVNTGSTLSASFSRHSTLFSTFFCHSVEAGEKAGQLGEVLGRLVATLEQDYETRTLVRNALRYPTLVLTFLAVAFTMIVTMIIPKIAQFYDRAGVNLPLPSRILIETGNFCQEHGIFLLCVAIASFLAIRIYKRTESGKWIWDSIMMRLPILGELFHKMALVKFLSTLRTLYSSGVLLTDALEISSRVVDNSVVSRAVTKGARRVTEGAASLSESLSEQKLFPPMILRIVAVGEKTGSLSPALLRATEHYDRDIRNMTKLMPSLIEPMLTVIFGFMILVLALGVFLPMWQVINVFRTG